MKKTIKIFCALACGAIIALCGYSLKKNNIVAIKHVLTTKQECVDVFGDKIGKKIRNGKKSKLCPIKITVNNKTSKNLVFHETDLKTAPKKLVLKKLQPCNPIAIGLSLGLGTFLVSSVTILAASLFNPAATIALALPIVGAAYLYKEPRMLKKKIKKMYMPVGAFIGVSGLVGILLYSLSITIFAPITAATYIYKKTKKNKRYVQQITNNFFEPPTIKAGETQSFFLFVKQSEYEEKPFSLTFKNIENESELFTVTV